MQDKYSSSSVLLSPLYIIKGLSQSKLYIPEQLSKQKIHNFLKPILQFCGKLLVFKLNLLVTEIHLSIVVSSSLIFLNGSSFCT